MSATCSHTLTSRSTSSFWLCWRSFFLGTSTGLCKSCFHLCELLPSPPSFRFFFAATDNGDSLSFMPKSRKKKKKKWK
jgi:hypothetical protein